MTRWRPALIEVTRSGRGPLVRGPTVPVDVLQVELDAAAADGDVSDVTACATELAVVAAAGGDVMHPRVRSVVSSLRTRGVTVGLVVLETHVGSMDARLELSGSTDAAVLSAQPDTPVAAALLGGMVLPGLIGYSGHELRQLLRAPCAGVVHEIDHRAAAVGGGAREMLGSPWLQAAHLAVMCVGDTQLDDIQRVFAACAHAMRPGRDLVACAYSTAGGEDTRAFVTGFVRRRAFAQLVGGADAGGV